MEDSLNWSSALFLKRSFPDYQDIKGSFEQKGSFGRVMWSNHERGMFPATPVASTLGTRVRRCLPYSLLPAPFFNTGTSDDGS
ncbi:hypothetical protein F7734_03415 [Scytonema sp. UIC 10036]|uniref:hypothetical protein n=1 Tax=Scytonema sp. UIC 10036 TaxID=2304196 RepID=UPI0012DAF60A|nr:hypothetical protein [Scytonema sp. UIC 10036]MUG91584.1 hypothetical protein [Scytonema sp. UIC 10036]